MTPGKNTAEVAFDDPKLDGRDCTGYIDQTAADHDVDVLRLMPAVFVIQRIRFIAMRNDSACVPQHLPPASGRGVDRSPSRPAIH
ncbi:hypothetical protein KDW54_23310 [Burkholderia ambifaria]|uniref:hypothetical protein n=1 Tax=Burkholderia ambifaria TaxID=152480 RepID=UPI001B9CB9B0|nr:hypothetical protein [Burkholderia ambifaria]MBR8185324.1 hypothetical protein [Burkholderia ambifaria]